MKKNSKLIVILLVLSMILPGMVQAAEIDKTEEIVERIYDLNRIKTAIEVSKKAYPDTAAAVVLAGYDGEPDALTGTLLAAAKDAPLLLTKKDEVHPDLKAEISRLEAKKIYILGGKGVISDKVKNKLAEDDKVTVERIWGENRYETAAKIAEVVGEAGGQTKHIFLAEGDKNLVDALSIGPVSARDGIPVLLTKADGLPAATIKAIKTLGVNKVTILGGKGAVSEAVEKQLKGLDCKIQERIEGSDRYKTALEIAKRYFPKAKQAIIAKGEGKPFADGLVGGYYGNKIKTPILLTQSNKLSESTKTYISENLDKTYVLGGDEAIENKVLENIKTAIGASDTTAEEYITEDQKWGRIGEGNLGSHGGIVTSYDGYLGYGYNMITAAYYNQKDINSAHPVVDMSSLVKENKVYIDYDTNFADPKTYIFSSLKEYSKELSAKANVEANFPLAGSIKANFGIDTSYQMISNQKLATLQANLETRKDYIMENSPELLAKHLTGGFKTSVDKLSQNATDKAIKNFITRYGTHVLTNVTMGGRFDLNYLYTNKSGSESSDVSASLQASYKYVEGSTDTNVKTAKKEIEENSNIKITTYGGSVTVDPVSIESAMASYKDWSTQVQDGKITLVDASEVIPIWKIVEAMDENYKSLSSAIESYCIKEGINTIGMFKDTKGLPVPPKTYISDIYIGYGDSTAEAKGMLRNRGVLDANIVNLDLNSGAGGRWIYLGYKKTTSKNKAITHILADYWRSSRTKNITSNGFDMQIIPTDLNRGAGGKHIYLYYTRNPRAGQPLTEIIYQLENKIQGGSADGYNGLRCYTTGELMDLNMDTTKTGDLIYLWFKRN